MILSVQNISKAFSEKQVLKNASFHIEENEKAAIVGINGAGKSTLLKIIVGEMQADEGSIILAKGKTLGYLAQHQDLSGERTIYDELLSVKQNLIDLEIRMRQTECSMKALEGDALEQQMALYSSLTHQFESQNGYAYQSELIGVLKGLGFEEKDFKREIHTLSGGQKTRVALGKLLLLNPDIILLDEPTNHLDMSSISWLETYLLNYKGAVVIVSHDRYFLDRTVQKIIEVDQTKVTSFIGNYSEYAVKKEQLRTAAWNAYMNQQREIRHQEAVIEKLRSFNREKSIRRAESREKMLDKMELLEKPSEAKADMKMVLTPYRESGNDVLSVEGLSKAFGDLKLFENLSFEIKRGEHVAIIGDNGTGKTTILKLINELLPIDCGTIRLGSNVEIGYYDQEHHVLHMEKTLFEEISDDYPYLNNTEIRNTLAAFLFTGEDVFKRIGDLSGGERGRVSLAKLMLSESNFLILDEPTNHLDIISKEILESALNAYTGTVLYVSHDRYFINKTATRILDLTGQTLVNYNGNYDYYLEKHDTVMKAAGLEPLSSMQTAQTTTIRSSTMESTENKQDWKEWKEQQAAQRKRENDIKKCEDAIAALENELADLEAEITLPQYSSNVAKLQELTSKQAEVTSQLEKLYEKWENLSEN
ncbi:MAG: ABC-F type ribosomal protection protein [Clostridiales bacterium]|nr:ABC-F type ribosomal protection protein [Clostridiales bacterium]